MMITRRTFFSTLLAAVGGLGLAACSRGNDGTNVSGGTNAGDTSDSSQSVVGGVATDDTTTSQANEGATAQAAEEEWNVLSDDGLRETVSMDLPDWSNVDFDHVSPDPADSEGTVLTAAVDPTRSQQLFLWEENNVPASMRSSRSGYDPADFRPTVTSVPATGGWRDDEASGGLASNEAQVKGAVLLCAGGAFAIRGDNSDCYPTANALAARGYQCFVVDYRVHPYTQAESGLDLARAIRFVSAHWQDYGLPSERAIAVGGYSAGGILCGETILNQGGSHSPAEVDASYQPDELDEVDASVAACAIIYSFYGRLSWAEKSADVLRAGNLPPTYYCYGTRDPFYDQFEGQVDLMASLGYTVRARVLQNWPHGFGAEGGWIPEFDQFMQAAFAE